MKRSSFLKSLLGIAVAPKIAIEAARNDPFKAAPLLTRELPTVTQRVSKTWPIYPDRVEFFHGGNNVYYHFISYVKINRNNIDYLVLVREIGVNEKEYAEKRFEYSCKEVYDKFIVPEDGRFVIRYNKHIHKN
jgi:hypothetical protein